MFDLTVHFFKKDGSEHTEPDWYCGRCYGHYPLVQFESYEVLPKVGDISHRHAGHGCFRDWQVVAVDERTMFLQRM